MPLRTDRVLHWSETKATALLSLRSSKFPQAHEGDAGLRLGLHRRVVRVRLARGVLRGHGGDLGPVVTRFSVEGGKSETKGVLQAGL